MFKVGDKPVSGFCLEKFLGRGGFGEVWQASALGETSAALKIVNLATEEGFKEYRGIQRVKQLQHPNLVPITGIWMLDEQGRLISDDVVRDLAASRVSPSGESIRATTLVVAMLLADCNLEQRLTACRTASRYFLEAFYQAFADGSVRGARRCRAFPPPGAQAARRATGPVAVRFHRAFHQADSRSDEPEMVSAAFRQSP